MANTYFVYIVMCSDDTLYTGYTVDIDKRMTAHNKGAGAKYTRARLPVELKYVELFDTKSEALKREYEIKQLSRNEKFKLMEVME
ncbi:GIY-YIG nuclease family protein [Phocicoccus pinnipedialis]|uniref:GIY-YIG nuclease superfamily protein n=1 Tax=Phocicoccus pinnipedialis TaxID=110845 RepID=A0A6V7R4I0_9BACL|nr:GIY-YIG nuclease family protein [Jeotgalicoccus pinnipedialis]MBP1940117.1 putative endonuclease [Jeotgalicoccus pinnipedialis]CAD2071935.1 GIY-YIG nuclease superfamily protein [Jeotgalicoccus pinnipedialis]